MVKTVVRVPIRLAVQNRVAFKPYQEVEPRGRKHRDGVPHCPGAQARRRHSRPQVAGPDCAS
ncbi:hypothetical protein PSCLAVI8L_120051 [Pseudoclavibacter sp. 8L]|nr:hypothetical protein PSCLAVI8L_120051 [Pseudoclavibacter sp. 8L]